jgi:hypothetical protein
LVTCRFDSDLRHLNNKQHASVGHWQAQVAVTHPPSGFAGSTPARRTESSRHTPCAVAFSRLTSALSRLGNQSARGNGTAERACYFGPFVYRFRTRAPQARKAGSIPARVALAKWRNWKTHDAQNVGPLWAWEFESPLGHSLIAGAAGAQLTFIRSVRPVRYRGLQLEDGRVRKLGKAARSRAS